MYAEINDFLMYLFGGALGLQSTVRSVKTKVNIKEARLLTKQWETKKGLVIIFD